MESPLEFKKLTEKFRGLDKLNLAVALVDNSFNVLHFNSGFNRLFQPGDEHPEARKLEALFSNFSIKLDALKQAGLLTGHLLNFVIPGVKQSDRDRFFDLQVGRLDQENDQLEGFSVTFVDVTDREREILSLRENSDHHKKFLQHTTSGVMIHRDGKAVFVNDQIAKMVRASNKESLIGKSILDFVTEEFRNIIIDRVTKMTETNQPAELLEEVVIREDNTTFEAEIFAFPVSFGGAPAIKVIIHDISVRKETERKLRSSEKKYHELVENVQDVIFQTDIDANITFLNSAWNSLTGYEVKDTIGKSVLSFIYDNKDNSEALYLKIKRLLMLGVSTHERDLMIKTKYEGHKFIQVKFTAIYNDDHSIVGISGMVIDIDARKKAELELQRIEESLRKQQKIFVNIAKSEILNGDDFVKSVRYFAKTSVDVLKIDRVNIWKFDEERGSLNCITNYDNAIGEYSGEGEVLENFKGYIDLIKEERLVNADDARTDPRVEDFLDSYIVPSGIYSMMDAGIYIGEDLWGVVCFDTTIAKRHWSIEDQSFASNIADMIGLTLVNSDKKVATQALEKSELLYSTLVDNAGDAIMIISSDGIIEEVNKRSLEMSGYSRDELEGKPVSTFLPERYLKEGNSLMEGFTTNQPLRKNRFVKAKDGSERLMEVSSTMMDDGRVLSILRDVTDRESNARALRESETRLDLALKGADLGTWDYYINEDKIIHNRRWSEMLGYNFEITTVNEQFWEKFVHPADIEPANEKFQQHLRGETPRYEATIRMLASSGEWRWILDKGKIVEWDENGEPLRASGIHQDVTALKTIEKEIKNQRLFLQQIINAIPYPLYVKNINDEFVLINNSFAEFLGVDRQEVLQYKFNKKYPFDSTKKALFEPDYEIYLNRQPMEIEEHELLNSSTGITHWLHTLKVPLKDSEGNLHEILSVSTDISKLKERELRMAVNNEMMDNKLASRTAMLEQAISEIETFNYSVSHDLRTPLRTIDIFAYFLEKNYADLLDSEGKENIQQIRSSITKMTTLIDNLLVYIKMGKIDVNKEDIELKGLLEEVIKDVGKLLDVRNVNFEFKDLPRFYADRNMLKQALFNLVTNAVKFTSTQSEPVIRFEGDLGTDDSVLRIIDNGVGFSMEYKDKLFKAFKRLHSEEHFEGTGVGLAIVEKIISRHKGQIWAESELNTSTTFFVKLPLK